jgi:hypothetical protein
MWAIVGLIGGTGLSLFMIACVWASYRLGVNDGWGYAKDPTCPGYQRARRILQSYGKIE